MITRESLADVAFLLPARVHQDRERFVAALRAELAAVIAALPTAGTEKGRDVARPIPPSRHPRESEDGHS